MLIIKMKPTCLATFAALLMFCDPVEARRTTTVKGRNTRSPRVEGCDPFCLFENDNNSWCFLMDPPMLRAGW
jgi:hypothetical protein